MVCWVKVDTGYTGTVMTADASSRTPADPGFDWGGAERLVEEIAQLAEFAKSTEDFFGGVLSRASVLVPGGASAIWISTDEGQLELVAESGLSKYVPSGNSTPAIRRHGEWLAATLLAPGSPGTLPAVRRGRLLHRVASRECGLGSEPSEGAARTFEVIALAPCLLDRQIDCVLELVATEGGFRLEESEVLAFTEAVVEVIGDHQRGRRLSDLVARQSLWWKLNHFAEVVHRKLDVQSTAVEICNEGRGIVECDRLSFVMADQGGFRMLAVSGVDEIDPRADTVRALESLAAETARMHEAIVYSSDGKVAPAEAEPCVQRVVDATHARGLCAILLEDDQSDVGRLAGGDAVLGVLIAERFEGAAHELSTLRRLESISGHCRSALRNARSYSRIPWARAWDAFCRSWIAQTVGNWRKSAVVVAGIAAFAAAMVAIPAELRIDAEGAVQPVIRRRVFAPMNGVIDEIRVAHGGRVAAGDVVLTIRNTDLEMETTRVTGEMQTTRKRLAAIESERRGGRSGRDGDRDSRARLAADEEELKKQLENLAEQQTLLRRQAEELVVRSPIDGEVLTWDVDAMLRSRPVQRGHLLLEIADLDGPWEVDLEIDGRHAGYVIAAYREADEPLSVEFLTADDPGKRHRATLGGLALSMEANRENESVLQGTLRLEEGRGGSFRAGTRVSAEVACGTRAIGFVWFRGVIDFVRSRLWL